jgi:hypothetical protein
VDNMIFTGNIPKIFGDFKQVMIKERWQILVLWPTI